MAHLRTTLGVRALSAEMLDGLRTLFGPIDPETALSLAVNAEWTTLESGDVLCRQGEIGDRLYILLTGRLQASWRTPEGEDRIIADIGRAELVGEMSFFSGEPRSANVYALRDSVLLAYTREVFDQIAASYPDATSRVVRVLIQRLKRRTASRPAAARVSNIAVVPLHAGIDMRALVHRLTNALGVHGRTNHLDSGRIDELLGERDAAQASVNQTAGPRLSAWLDEQESAYRYIVYAADGTASEWTERCIRQADWILLVADSLAPRAAEDIDRLLASYAGRVSVHRTLVLIHKSGDRLPTGTLRWLTGRGVDDHLHLRWDSSRDIVRLAQRLAGRSVGLVLGGGGARGFAHIGVIRALEEAGIPIDRVGGTSMGAFIGAQYAMGLDVETMVENFRLVWLQMRPQYEVTVPLVSFVGNRRAKECGQLLYGDTQVEDCWTNFFCVSSNLTKAEMMVHRTGALRTATLASASLPIFAPPILHGNDLLVDGGLVNNLPTDVMRQMGADHVIACKVSVDEDEAFSVDRVPTPWQIINRRFGKRAERKFPSLVEMLGRATMLGSVRQESAAIREVDLSFVPPVEQFGLLDFRAIDRVVKVGYEYAQRRLAETNNESWCPPSGAAPAAITESSSLLRATVSL